MTPEICPNCGEPVPPRSRACPECGADEQTGWSDDAVLGRLGLPSEEFDYEEFVRNEFPESSNAPRRSPIRPKGIRPLWWLVAVVLLAGAMWVMLRSLWQ